MCLSPLRITRNAKTIFLDLIAVMLLGAGPSDRAVKGVGLQPLAC